LLKDKEKALTGIAHLCILFQFVGLAITFVIYFLEKDSSDFIRKGVKQAIGLQVLVSIFALVYRLAILFGFTGSRTIFSAVGVFWLLYLLAIGFALYAAVKSFKGSYYEYPLINRFIS